MRIAMIAPFHQLGGSEHQILLLLRGLQRKGVESVLFHLDIKSLDLLGALESIPGCEHVELHVHSVRGMLPFFVDELRVASRLRRHECELVHCWNYTGHIVGGVASRMARLPCIFSIGGLDPWKKAWQLPLYRMLNQLADLFVFQSRAELDLVSRRERIPIERTRIIPNGVDHQRFRVANQNLTRAEVRGELNLHPSLPLVLSVGSLREIKGHDVFIEAVRRIRETQPDLPFHALIVGAGPFREAYGQSARGLPISFAGFRKDVERFYLAADLYCQPSRSEGLPNAVIEAMCCGLPIVASDVGGLAGLVTVDNGLLCVPGDPEDLARQLCQMLARPELWPSMGLASRRLSEGFSLERMVDSCVSAYMDLLSKT